MLAKASVIREVTPLSGLSFPIYKRKEAGVDDLWHSRVQEPSTFENWDPALFLQKRAGLRVGRERG